MPRTARLAVPGCAHHIRQRGVRKEPVFHEDRDFLVYSRILRKRSLEQRLEICAYALMTNHLHLIAVPDGEDSLSRALHAAHTEYACYFNAKYGFVGHVFQARPDVSVMDEVHTWNAVRYVERNPVRARMVENAEDYLWSSAAAHCGLRSDILLTGSLPFFNEIEDWSGWLTIENTDDELRAIRRHLNMGSPWTTPEFLRELERVTGRSLGPGKRGRPRKENPGQTTHFPFFGTKNGK